MKRLTALLIVLALMVLMTPSVFAQGTDAFIVIELDEQNDSGISGEATIEDLGDGSTAVTVVLEGLDPGGEYAAHIHAGRCPEVGDVTYPLDPVTFGEPDSFSFTTLDTPIEEILAQQSAINVHLHSDPSVYVACGNLPVQETDTGKTVTKRFELTLNGTVPEADAFYIAYAETDRVGSEASIIVLCGEPGFEGTPGEAACDGDGVVHAVPVEFPAGTEIEFGFFRKEAVDAEAERFHGGTETISTDMTNRAWYTFGKGTGAGDKQETPDNQQQDDTQDDTPGEMPDTGAGGMAAAGGVPVGGIAGGVSLLLLSGYALLRRR